MTSKRLFFLLIGLIGCTIVAIVGMAVLGNIVLKKQSAKLVEAKAEYASLDAQELAFKQAQKDIVKYSELNTLTKRIVPQDKDQAKTLREIYKIAESNGVPVKTITFSTSTLGEKSGTSSKTDPKSATPSAQQSTSITQVKPVDGINGVYTMEIILANDADNLVSFDNITKFMTGLESNRRTAHISNITLTPDRKKGNRLTYNITLRVYIKPEATK